MISRPVSAVTLFWEWVNQFLRWTTLHMLSIIDNRASTTLVDSAGNQTRDLRSQTRSECSTMRLTVLVLSLKQLSDVKHRNLSSLPYIKSYIKCFNNNKTHTRIYCLGILNNQLAEGKNEWNTSYKDQQYQNYKHVMKKLKGFTKLAIKLDVYRYCMMPVS